MSKDRKKQARKRKKSAEKKRRAGPAPSLAYLGSKYQTDELVPTWLHTEIGIYQTYVFTDRKLLDQTVAAGLETLVRKLRAGRLPPISQTDAVRYDVGGEEALLIENIRRCWAL